MPISRELVRRHPAQSNEGFTLIELLVVIVVIAILAAIVIFAVQFLSQQTATATCQTDFKTLQAAAETYKAQLAVYPGEVLPASYTAGAPGIAPAGSAANGPVLALMGPVNGPNGTILGPWLKNYPYNAGHYQLELGDTSATYGVVSVYNTASVPTQIPASGAQNTIADCTGVG
jgi:prepilin-type N-terminal cleavage/methylation domain-containing protein